MQLPVQNQIPCAGSFGCQRIHVALNKHDDKLDRLEEICFMEKLITRKEAAETASAWYLILNRKLQTLPIYITRLSSHLPRPLTMGTQQVSAGAAVITPQHRSYRVPQGSPQVFGGP